MGKIKSAFSNFVRNVGDDIGYLGNRMAWRVANRLNDIKKGKWLELNQST